jgi:hypothetical protein
MSIVSLIVILVILALLYWGANTAPFIIGQFRAILSWLFIALAIGALVVFVLGIFGVTVPTGNLHWK